MQKKQRKKEKRRKKNETMTVTKNKIREEKNE
jgi:hypothetical protein